MPLNRWVPVDADFYERLERAGPRYLENQRARLQKLETAFELQDFAAIQLLAHRTKGTAGPYGFPELGALATTLLAAAQATDSTAVRAILGQLSAFLEQRRQSGDASANN